MSELEDSLFTDDKQEPKKPDVLDQHCQHIMEHYDSVLILVTKHDPKTNETVFDWRGRGNRFASAGAVEAWMAKDDENTRMGSFFEEWDEGDDLFEE